MPIVTPYLFSFTHPHRNPLLTHPHLLSLPLHAHNPSTHPDPPQSVLPIHSNVFSPSLPSHPQSPSLSTQALHHSTVTKQHKNYKPIENSFAPSVVLEALKDFYSNVAFFVKDGEVRAFAGGGVVPPRAPEEIDESAEKKEKGSQAGSGDAGSAEGGSAAGDDAALGYFKGLNPCPVPSVNPPIIHSYIKYSWQLLFPLNIPYQPTLTMYHIIFPLSFHPIYTPYQLTLSIYTNYPSQAILPTVYLATWLSLCAKNTSCYVQKRRSRLSKKENSTKTM